MSDQQLVECVVPPGYYCTIERTWEWYETVGLVLGFGLLMVLLFGGVAIVMWAADR